MTRHPAIRVQTLVSTFARPGAVAGGILALALSLAASGNAQVLPAATTLSVRLLDSVTAHPASRGRTVRGMVLAPVMHGTQLLVAPRTVLEGRILDAGTERAGGARRFLHLRFDALHADADTPVPLATRVVSVDNARESVDTSGVILGPPLASVAKSKSDWALLALGTIDPLAAAAFFAAMRGEELERHRGIHLSAGTDLTVQTLTDAPLKQWPVFVGPDSLPLDASLRSLLESLPSRSLTAHARLPGDFVNVVFVASDSALHRAFRSAGWDQPERMGTRADFETFLMAARGQGYAHMPVSEQTMFGRAPDVVFQRVADTFAKRHHIRIWRTAAQWNGTPVWAAAATHDIGVEFSRERRGFTHRTDPAIDGEREKVVTDLIASLSVARIAYLPRPVPTQQPTRDIVSSDWRIATLVLRD